MNLTIIKSTKPLQHRFLITLKIWKSDELSRQFGLKGILGKANSTKLNIKESSLAVAYPFTNTDGRIIATLAKLLNERGERKGFISVCAARRQGIIIISEK